MKPSSPTSLDSLVIEDRAAAVGVVRIMRLNRPRQRNALTTALLEVLYVALTDAGSDPAVRAVVLTAEGATFCAGGDVKEFVGHAADRDAVMLRSKLMSDVAAQLQRGPTPTVAAVNGSAVGGGAWLALACDMVVAATDLRLGFPELQHSVVPSLVMPSAVTVLGRKLAFDLLTTGRLLSAEEAENYGLVNQIVEPARILETALAVAYRWADVAPDAMAETKRLFNTMCELSPTAAGQLALEATRELWKPRL